MSQDSCSFYTYGIDKFSAYPYLQWFYMCCCSGIVRLMSWTSFDLANITVQYKKWEVRNSSQVAELCQKHGRSVSVLNIMCVTRHVTKWTIMVLSWVFSIFLYLYVCKWLLFLVNSVRLGFPSMHLAWDSKRELLWDARALID